MIQCSKYASLSIKNKENRSIMAVEECTEVN